MESQQFYYQSANFENFCLNSLNLGRASGKNNKKSPTFTTPIHSLKMVDNINWLVKDQGLTLSKWYTSDMYT